MKMRVFREKLVEVLGEPDSESKMVDSFVKWEWSSFEVCIYGIWDDSECWIIDIYNREDIILDVESPEAVLILAKQIKKGD